MYLPRSLISHLYLHLQKSSHVLSPPVLILVALEPDALCACRILTSLLKRDYISHKIHPITGYIDLAQAGDQFIKPLRHSQGGTGGIIVCLGVGGLVDLESTLLGSDVEQETWYALEDMPDVDEDGAELQESDNGVASGAESDGSEHPDSPSQKRKSWSDDEGEESDKENTTPSKKRKSNAVSA